MIALLLSAVLAAQDAAERLNSAPDKRVELDFQHYYDVEEIGASLARLAEAYPELLAVDSIGRSAGGRELWCATVGETARGELAARPAIALISGLAAGDVVGTEMTLCALYDLLQNHGRDPRAAGLLGRATLYLVPCADPDRRAELFAGRARAGPGSPRIDLDFPSAWDPWADGAGPYPLSTPEARGLVACLLARPNVVAVVTTGVGAAMPRTREDLPAEDRAAYERALAAFADARGRLAVLGADRAPRERGGLAEFAARELGAFAFDVRTPAGDGVPPPGEILDLGREHTRALLELAGALPRLELRFLATTRLKSDLWQVEVELADTAALGGTTRSARERGRADGIDLSARGARLVALGTRAEGAADFAPLQLGDAGATAALEPLSGGERRRLRLMVQGEEGAELVVGCAGPRWGVAEARARLE